MATWKLMSQFMHWKKKPRIWTSNLVLKMSPSSKTWAGENKFTSCGFTVFGRFTWFPFPVIAYILTYLPFVLKICQTVAGVTMISQFHDFFILMSTVPPPQFFELPPCLSRFHFYENCKKNPIFVIAIFMHFEIEYRYLWCTYFKNKWKQFQIDS